MIGPLLKLLLISKFRPLLSAQHQTKLKNHITSYTQALNDKRSFRHFYLLKTSLLDESAGQICGQNIGLIVQISFTEFKAVSSDEKGK